MPKLGVASVTEEWPHNSRVQVGRRSENVVRGAITTQTHG